MKNLVIALGLVLVSLPALADTALADNKLSGVDPRVYLKSRHAEPNVVRELRHAPLDVTEHILRDGPDAFLVPESAYPDFVKADEMKRLRAGERRALVIGALTVAGEKRLPKLIVGHLTNPDDQLRAEAAERYGEAGGDALELGDIARRDPNLTVRTAAIAGLGRQRTSVALDVLEPFVLDASLDETTRASAVRATGILASKWAWQALGDMAQGERIRARANAMLAKISASERKGALGAAVRDVERMLSR